MRKLSSRLGDIHDFTSREAQQLLHNKFVVIIGDSNYRAIYKDLVYILQTDRMLTLPQLKQKDEESFANDCRVEFNGAHSGNDYRLVRQYRTGHHLVRFYFVTRVYSSYMESILNDFKAGLEAGLVPDVVILNSCLWDLNRYHDDIPTEPPLPKALREYCQNAEKLFRALDDILPSTSLIIWTTALPIANEARGYIVEHPHKASPKDLIEANFHSSLLARQCWLDVLDLHYRFQLLEDLRNEGGIHWDFQAHRCITKVFLTHIAEAWQVELEKRRPQIEIQREGNPENQQACLWRALPQALGQPLQVTCSPFLGLPTSHRTWPYTHRKAKYRHRPRGGYLSNLPSAHGSYIRGPQCGPGYEQSLLPSPYLSTPRNYFYTPHCAGYDRSPIGFVEQEHYSQPSYNYSSPAPHNPGDDDSGSMCSFEPEHCPQSTPNDYSLAGYGRRPISSIEQEYCPQPSPTFFSPAPCNPCDDQRSLCSFEPESNPSDYCHSGDACRPINLVEQEHYPQFSPYYNSGTPQSAGGGWKSLWQLESAAPHQFHPGSSPFLLPNPSWVPWFVDGNEEEPFSPLHMEESHCNSSPAPGLATPEECPDSFWLLRRSPRGNFRKMCSTRRQRHNAYTPYAKLWNNSRAPH